MMRNGDDFVLYAPEWPELPHPTTDGPRVYTWFTTTQIRVYLNGVQAGPL